MNFVGEEETTGVKKGLIKQDDWITDASVCCKIVTWEDSRGRAPRPTGGSNVPLFTTLVAGGVFEIPGPHVMSSTATMTGLKLLPLAYVLRE